VPHVYSPENGYNLGAALASARTTPSGEGAGVARDPQRDAEYSYLRTFSAGGFASEISYGNGRPTKAEHGAVVTVAPTAEDFHRHAQLYGPELVKETAAAFGGKELSVTAAPKSTAKRQRRTTSSLREQILGLHRRGLVPAAIADTLSVSDRRVKEILTA